MGTCGHFSRSSPSNSWWQTMAGWQVLSRPSAAEGGGSRPAFTGLATRPYSATEVDGWQHKLSRVSQNRSAVQIVVGGLPVHPYRAEDAVAEAYAMVFLVESGFAQQTDVARAFDRSVRTVRRHQA